MNEKAVTREIYWNISELGQQLFMALAIFSMMVFAYGIYMQVRRVIKGRKEDFSLKWVGWGGLITSLKELITNRKLFRQQKKTGTMHLFILWGFITLFIGTTLVAIEYDLFQVILGKEQGFLYGNFFLGFELVLDVMGALFLVALIYAVFRRYKNSRKQLRKELHDYAFPILLIVILVTGYLVEILRISANAENLTYNPAWSPVAWLGAKLFTDIDVSLLRDFHLYTWWFHAFIVFSWIATIPVFPKTIHILTSILNTLLKESRPNGRMEKIDVEAAFEKEETLGVMTIADLNIKQRLDLISCTECGRCDMSCPAMISGKTLSPRNIILDMQKQFKQEVPVFAMFGKATASGKGGVILDTSIAREDIWACTSCKACVEACPVYIDPLEKIQALRKSEVMMNDQYPKEYTDVFTGVEKRGNPWNMHPSTRLDWAKGLDVPVMADIIAQEKQVDYLYWVGCSGAFDPRSQKISRSLVNIMNACGVSFAVLGEEESCTGDALRRIGNEYQFAMQAETNVEILSQMPFKKVVTTCPHCFNSLKNEYPEFGGNFETIHHTQLIDELFDAGKIDVKKSIEDSVTFHDSCYLGRYNNEYDAPRKILAAICKEEVVEMAANKSEGMCCGAGGGMMWVEEDQDKRVNMKRAEQVEETLSTEGKAACGTVASSCPFCMTMMEDSLGNNEEIDKKDIAELVSEAMDI